MSEVEEFRKSLMDKFEDAKTKATKFHELVFLDIILAVIETHQITPIEQKSEKDEDN